MKIAIDRAKVALKEGEVPVGCVIVNNKGDIISYGSNKNILDKDVTSHAEIVALRAVSHQRYFHECDIYITLEPCPMCFAALSMARIQRIYFGAYDMQYGGISACSITLPHKPEIYGGIMEAECKLLLNDFFKSLR